MGPRRAALTWLVEGPILKPLIAACAATIIAVGPWIVSVAALALVSVTMTSALGAAALENLRLAVVYAFALALLATGPIATVAARLLRSDLDVEKACQSAEIYTVASLAGAFATLALALALVAVLADMSARMAVAFVVLAVAASLLWTDFAMMSALRRYSPLIGAFGVGMLLAVVSGLWLLRLTSSIEAMLWCYSAGVLYAHFRLAAMMKGCQQLHWQACRTAARRLLAEGRARAALLIGITLGFIAVWIDKAVLWFSPIGMASASSFPHYAPYDSAMFLVHLAMIPTLSGIFLVHEYTIRPRLTRFWHLVNHQGTHALLAEAAKNLLDKTLERVFQLIFFQFSICFILLMASDLWLWQFMSETEQLAIIRIGLLAVCLQSLFFSMSYILLITCQEMKFVVVNLVFLIANGLLSTLLYGAIGVSAYGVFGASLIAAVTAFLFTASALRQWLFIVFISGNNALYSTARPSAARKQSS